MARMIDITKGLVTISPFPEELLAALPEFGIRPRAAPLEEALRDEGTDVLLLAVRSPDDFGTISAARGGRPQATHVAACTDAMWVGDALRHGADFAVHANGDALVSAVKRATEHAALRRKLAAFERAAAATIPGSKLEDIERQAILVALDAAGGSTARAAAMLDVSVRKIQYKLHDYGVAPRRRTAAAVHASIHGQVAHTNGGARY